MGTKVQCISGANFFPWLMGLEHLSATHFWAPTKGQHSKYIEFPLDEVTFFLHRMFVTPFVASLEWLPVSSPDPGLPRFTQVHSRALVRLQHHVWAGRSGARGEVPRVPDIHTDGDRATRGRVWRPPAAHRAALPPGTLWWEPHLPWAGRLPAGAGQWDDLRLGVCWLHPLHCHVFGRYVIFLFRGQLGLALRMVWEITKSVKPNMQISRSQKEVKVLK